MVHGTHNAVHDSRNEKIKIYINGDYYLRNEAKISVFDSGYLVGDGIWEAVRLVKGKLIFIDDHISRLWAASKTIGIKLPFSKDELIDIINGVLKENDMYDGVHVRFMVTRGIKKTPSQDPRLTISEPNLVVIPEYKLADSSSKTKGIKLFTSTIRRGSPDYLDPKLNCHSKLHEVQALIQAIEAGADEALMLDVNGAVSTCNSTNFFIVKNGVVFTSTGQYCMNGITRQKIIEVCERKNIICKQENYSLFDVYGADEAFVTGTFAGLTTVVSVDGREIGTNSKNRIAKILTEGYKELVDEQIERE